MDKAAKTKTEYAHHHRIALPDGTVKFIHALGHPVLNSGGDVVEFVGTAVDVTERRRAEEALRRSEAYLAEAQRLTHTGSWAYNPATEKAVYWSDEMYRIFGLDPKRGILPDRKEFERLMHPDDHSKFYERVENAFREKTDFVQDYRIVLPDGTIRHLHEIGHPVLDENGNIVEYLGTEVDVTERKRAEEERESLRQLEADLAHLNRVSMMGELAASLAHEIKQPIAAAATNARTCLRWLQREPADIAEAREALSRIVKDANRAADIIDRNRSLYKRDKPKREMIDLNELIREMISLLYDKTHQYSISIRTELNAGLATIPADRVQLQQVLLNLMVNGAEAMADTSGELIITSNRTDDGQLLVSVSDSGVGLPVDEAEHIFDPFFTTKAQGTGMGLSISRRIIESHDGRLWATPNSDRGATFHFTLPIASKSVEMPTEGT
jgi:PAS domain S-box-containing protein